MQGFTGLLAFLTTLARVGQAIVAPTVTLDDATVTGVASGLTSTNQFLGIPYARPPTGNLRFRLPQPLSSYNTSFSAVKYGSACPQQPLLQFWPSNLPAETIDYLETLVLNTLTSSEDCLTLNVITPDDATPESKLPVVVWFHPGGFVLNGSPFHDGALTVERSISLSVPAVYVSMNYRQSAFGFLASKEVKDAGVGNLGLQDQRLALRWVQRYIGAFGGDPDKVTLWGYSSGAMSIALHMVTNGGNQEGLFRAAIMQSGSILPVGDISHGQPYYDTLVADAGCSGADDTLQCLREVPYHSLLYAMSQSPGPLYFMVAHPPWLPRVDGVFLTSNPMLLVQQGAIANIPVIVGDCDDEGTLMSLTTTNITTDAQFADYIKAYFLPNAPITTIDRVMKYYPSDPTKGSPFDTGSLNALTPQFKRLAAIQGDIIFQAPRRFILQNLVGKQNVWTYVSKRMKLVPYLGSFHTSDLIDAYGLTDMSSYFARFIANLDPNVGESTDLYWSQYDVTNRTMLGLLDGPVSQMPTTDTYRVQEIAYLTGLMLANPL